MVEYYMHACTAVKGCLNQGFKIFCIKGLKYSVNQVNRYSQFHKLSKNDGLHRITIY